MEILHQGCVPELIFDIHNCEDPCTMKACHNVLNGQKLIIFSLYCTIQIFGVKICVQLSILFGFCDSGAYPPSGCGHQSYDILHF